MKQNLAVLFGGESVEHEISIITALQAIKNVDENKYNVIPVYIKDSVWYTGESLLNVNTYKSKKIKAKQVFMLPNNKFLYTKEVFIKKYKYIDVALLCFHGNNGEDGCIQGLLELNHVPYTSAGVMGSALTSDKAFFKLILHSFNIPNARGHILYNYEYYSNMGNSLKLRGKIAFPVIVKPATLGSSIGIKICKNNAQFLEALELAFSLDKKVLIEEYYSNIKEVNCAILGYGDDVIISAVEEVVKSDGLLSFENKYMNNKKQGMASAKRKIPAEISDEQMEQVKELSRKLFSIFELKGVVRCDFIITSNGDVLVNELNSIPGSLAFYLFEPAGIPYKDLINKMIKYAYIANSESAKINRHFINNILDNIVGKEGTKG